jgi:hypothetical protein
MVLIISCNHKPVVKKAYVPYNIVDSTVTTDTVTEEDELASFISGVPGSKGECYGKLDTAVNWTQYSKDIDRLFSYGDSIRFNNVEKWAGSELIRNRNVGTVFYPFSGPDFLNADIYYPEVSQYILIGLEPIGRLPDICDKSADSVKSYLTDIKNNLTDLLKRSYFITRRMEGDLGKTKINGTLPIICLFIKRTGYHIQDIHKIGVDSLGNCLITDNMKKPGKLVKGVRIDFNKPSDGRMKSVYYFRLDISDQGLKKAPGFRTYLSRLPQSYTFLKAASYLLHFREFSTIRKLIFDISYTILQDESGIAYQLFNKKKWDIRLYGMYTKPKNEFSFIKEPELEKAFHHSVVKPLPYSLGYNWRSGHTSMLYAVKK